jgi:signal transduction histidine kinase
MKRMDRLKTAFLAQISHKLKTPLTSLSLGLEEMERYAANLHPGDPCHQRLSSMREDIASFSKALVSLFRMQEALVGPGGARVRCDPGEMVREALKQVESKTDCHRVVLDLPKLPLIMAEHDRITFALQQVLDNAFKFSHPGDAVSVVLAQQDEAIRIVVHDYGCGIRKDELPKIFDMSYQIDPDVTGQVPGFGLGLFCAREIIRQHGGSITVESREGMGTDVIILLPYSGFMVQQPISSRMMPVGLCMCELFSEGLVFLPV